MIIEVFLGDGRTAFIEGWGGDISSGSWINSEGYVD